MHINQLFDYKSYSRVDSPDGRRYQIGDTALPSVTTILAQTADKSYLDEWVAKVGAQEADRIRNEAADIGTSMHQNLENYILGKSMVGALLPKMLAQSIIKNGFPQIKSVIGVEVCLYSYGLYAGTTDLVAELENGKLAIIDFKNSRKLKSEDAIEDYRAQLGAYAIAHNEMYGTNIDTGIIMVATRSAEYQEFKYTGNDFYRCTDSWLQRLEQFYKENK